MLGRGRAEMTEEINMLRLRMHRCVLCTPSWFALPLVALCEGCFCCSRAKHNLSVGISVDSCKAWQQLPNRGSHHARTVTGHDQIQLAVMFSYWCLCLMLLSWKLAWAYGSFCASGLHNLLKIDHAALMISRRLCQVWFPFVVRSTAARIT